MINRIILLELLFGLILSYLIITKYFSGKRDFETLAMGTETLSYQALDETSTLIHIIKVNNSEENPLLIGWGRRGKKDVILFLGNSQTHSINQKKEKEVNYIELLHKNTLFNSVDIICNSIPNAGLQEFYLSYKYWKEKLSIKALIVPIFMDDMREDGIRDVFFPNLVDNRYILKDSSDYLNKKINSDLRTYWHNQPISDTLIKKNPEMAALHETFQEKVETYFNNTLDKYSVVWVNRPNVRGDFFNWLYKARNTVLGINANTVRKMIPQRYEYNMHALELIIEDCIKSNTKVLLYIPPIRSDVKIPYDENDYSKFKSTIERLANKYPNKVFYKNFESIIPGNLWGYKEATNLKDDREIDFMHFQFKGHQILADSLQPTIGRLIQE